MIRLLQRPWFDAWFIPALLYAIILAGSSVPGQEIPKVFKLTPDKLIHFVEYFVVSFFFARFLVSRSWSSQRVFFTTFVAGMLAAALDEYYQSFTPGRTPDVRDWLIDIAGVAAGAVVLLLLWRKRSTPQNF